MPERRRIVLLGATGSIGETTLRVLRAHPERFELVGIAGAKQTGKLAALAREFGVREVAIFDEEACTEARRTGIFPPECHLTSGPGGLEHLARLPGADLLVVAIVGTQALRPTLAAIGLGRDIALASKEILVLGGAFVTAALKDSPSRLLPADSEHNAIFQCLQGVRREDLRRILLTASGGRFREWPVGRMDEISPAMALDHPNWDMGPKITVDSSTMANKGLEVIEAHWLFDLEPDRIEVVVHPQSIVHSMVELVDGSILAQMSPPSMSFALQHCLLYPERAPGIDPTLDFSRPLSLDFLPPDLARFPCLRLALEALRAGGCAPGVFNAANEVGVARFLDGEIPFSGIPLIIDNTLEQTIGYRVETLDDLLACEAEAKSLARATDLS